MTICNQIYRATGVLPGSTKRDNPHDDPHSGAEAGNAVDAANTRAVLQQARRHSPPTLLCWVWSSTCASECQMVLMMNFDTLAPIAQPVDSPLLAFSGIIRDAWRRVTNGEHEGVMDITPLVINRSTQGAFALRYSQLQARVQGMTLPVMTARTGVIST